MNLIELGNNAGSTIKALFHFTAPSEKYTLTNQLFYTWYGLRMYLITGSKHPEYLAATSLEQIKAVRSGEWSFLDDLDDQLLEALEHNLKRFPFLECFLKEGETTVVWTTEGDEKVYLSWKSTVMKLMYKIKDSCTTV
jgi:hypothetical protein